jgi:hypothetical protein
MVMVGVRTRHLPTRQRDSLSQVALRPRVPLQPYVLRQKFSCLSRLCRRVLPLPLGIVDTRSSIALKGFTRFMDQLSGLISSHNCL